MVIRANNLEDADGPFNGSDPYAYIDICGDKQQTATVSGSSNPEWNEELVFEEIVSPANKVMKIAIYDDDTFKDDKIGECTLPLGKLVATDAPQEFTLVVDDGFFKDATITFVVTTDGSWGSPEGGSGDLVIFVEKCTGLKDADLIGKTDPYCYCKIEDVGNVRTETKSNTLNPVWEQELTLAGIPDPLTKKIEMIVYDDDMFKDDKIGSCTIDLGTLVMGQEMEFTQVIDTKFFGLWRKAKLSFKLVPQGWGNKAQ